MKTGLWILAGIGSALLLSFMASADYAEDTDSSADSGENIFDRPGDDRRGYDRPDFQTRSLALESRIGVPADLVGRAKQGMLGLPPLEIPESNPLTEERVALGRKVFFDRRLSLNRTQSCAMCHIAEQGFTNNETRTAVGIMGRSVGRNAPTLYNVGFFDELFHDSREESLEQLAWQPMLDKNEMANPSIGYVLQTIESLPDYDGRFEAAFDGRGPDIDTVPKALAAYQRTLISGNSPFDRWYFGDEEDAITESQIRGFEIFSGRGQCIACHTVKEDYALFTDQKLHNTGVGVERSRRSGSSEGSRVLIAPGVYMNISEETIRTVGSRLAPDLGRYRITEDPDDRWHFKTPSLRNVSLTAPYMHDGSLDSLEAVVEFYNDGGIENPLQDERIQPLGLTEQEREDLVAFLRSLTGEYRELVSDAFAAPVGNVGVERRIVPLEPGEGL
ncbi:MULTISPECIES: cytochrome-c peroxidase [unclassified Thioalkalivibrio]|uniref:cytochrome-c peroxidase n=1 Tax=unclassified Thioalkalivibrio TaxID=2621013 RepID=UPI000399C6F6|nr:MULTISPECIES: cytochrome c peroxidase [unclassified Thioalkalivibrio]